jgi:DNA-directed RNA polymerase specialized sigma24 family protein
VDRDELLADAYNNLKWALYGKGKLEINGSIQRKVRYLTELYNIGLEDILHDIFENFVSKKHYENFDPSEGKLSTFMTHYANLSLLNIIKKYKRINSKEVSLPDDYEDTFDQKSRFSLSYLENCALCGGFSEPITPEGYYLTKELLELMKEYFDADDFAVLTGMKTRQEVAQEKGLTYQTYRKQLYRRRKLFETVLEESGYLVN